MSSNSGIALDGADYAKFKYDGFMDFVHECTSDCQCHARYRFQSSGALIKLYEETKINKISDLNNESNLAFYPEADRDTLRSMVVSLDIASISGITELYIFKVDSDSEESDNSEHGKYYVIDYDLGENRIDEINNEYSIEIISENQRENKISKIGAGIEDRDVEWRKV